MVTYFVTPKGYAKSKWLASDITTLRKDIMNKSTVDTDKYTIEDRNKRYIGTLYRCLDNEYIWDSIYAYGFHELRMVKPTGNLVDIAKC